MTKRKLAIRIGVGLAMFAGLPFAAHADVKSGVDAWSRGDYSAAVQEWEGPAEQGDPDALFNLAQAYRLGRGVPQDQARAQTLYARAAAKGHLRAADTYGLMLFEEGRREEAIPYIQNAARRGDPRSQYLLGISHFNGDLVGKDWVRAYALMINANRQGLPQAQQALAQMDQMIPLEQRQMAAGLARDIEQEAKGARARELAAAELALRGGAGGSVGEDGPVVARTSGAGIPRPIENVTVSPSITSAREAVREAEQATGLEDPAAAGASYARPAEVAVAPPAPAPVVAAPPQPAARPAQPPPVARSAPPPASSSGPWRVQLGAFSVRGNADRLWSQLSGRAELAGKQKLLVPAGRVTKLQAGGFATQAAANAACSALKRAGQDCLVTR